MEEKRVALSVGELVYLEGGKGEPLVFFHGAIATPRAYLPFLTLFAKHYRVIAPTHPGHGDSFAITNDWELEDFIATYQNFFAALNVSKFAIVGHSFGGTLALLLANKGRAIQVIAMDPPGLPITFTMHSFLRAKKKELRAILNRPDRKQIQEVIAAAQTLIYTARRHSKELSWFMTKGPNFNIAEDLAKIQIPTAYFWGEEDGIVPVSVGKTMHELTPGSTLDIFPGRGHNYPVFDPEFTYRQLMSVIGKMH
ncbi:alpha/beta hydrolase [Candidatus Gottesmanbacteria bacterium]|nr:alpha/beta hydrolase [Candidatus Gottesmanbacteria bacterium]